MVTMEISLPDAMKAWLGAQVETGQYIDASEVIRTLVRREQLRAEKIANMNRLVEEARVSGLSTRSVEEIVQSARERVLARDKQIDV